MAAKCVSTVGLACIEMPDGSKQTAAMTLIVNDIAPTATVVTKFLSLETGEEITGYVGFSEGACMAQATMEISRHVVSVQDTAYVTPEPECAIIVCRETFYNLEPLFEVKWLDDKKTPLNPQPTEEEIMALQMYPAAVQAPTCERVDVLPLTVVGPAGPSNYSDLLTDALAANPVDYPTFGAAADTDEILVVNMMEVNGGGFLFNGTSVAAMTDPDGVNLNNELEVPDGCEVVVTFCLQRCLTKAEIAAL